MKNTKKLLISLLSYGFIFVAGTTGFTSVNADEGYYDYRADSTITEVVYHEIDEEEDTIISKEVFNRDENDKLISMYSYDYDEETGSYLEASYKEEYTYDAAGRETTYQEFDYDEATSTWKKTWGDENIYDEKGNLIKRGTFKYNDQDEKVYSGYSEMEYDANGLLIKDVMYSASMNNPEMCTTNSYYTYEYNDKNQLIKQTMYTNVFYDDPSEQYVQKIVKYTYAENGKEATVDSTQYLTSSDVYCCYYNVYEYDSQNRLTKDTEYVYEADNHQDLDTVYQHRYTYDGNACKDDSYYCYDCADGFNEDMLAFNSSITTIDTNEEYKHTSYHTDFEGNQIYETGYHTVREFEDGYITVEKFYDIDEEGNETLTSYNEITTKRVSKKKFPYWVIPTGSIVILLGAYTCGYFFLYEKGKLQGKFFNIIYTWLKNLLAKLTKKAN